MATDEETNGVTGSMEQVAQKKTVVKKTVTKKRAAKKRVAKKKTTKKKTVTKKQPAPKKAVAKTIKPEASMDIAPGTPMTEALGETFLIDLISDWREIGGGVIEICRTTKPDAYLKLIATYAPKEFRKTLEPFGELTDQDLKERLDHALKKINAIGLD